MDYNPRGWLVPAEIDNEYSNKVAEQTIRTSSVKSFIIIGVIVGLFIAAILTIFFLGL